MNTAIEELWGPDEEQALLDSIDAWVEKSVAPIAREYDLEDKYPHELVEEMKELVAIRGRYLRFCSSVPQRSIAAAMIRCELKMPVGAIHTDDTLITILA